MRARLDRIFTIRTPLPGSRCFEMYSNRDWEMGNAGKAVRLRGAVLVFVPIRVCI